MTKTSCSLLTTQKNLYGTQVFKMILGRVDKYKCTGLIENEFFFSEIALRTKNHKNLARRGWSDLLFCHVSLCKLMPQFQVTDQTVDNFWIYNNEYCYRIGLMMESVFFFKKKKTLPRRKRKK